MPLSRLYLRDLSSSTLNSRLRRGLRLQIGPFVTELRGRPEILAQSLHAHYPNYPVANDDEFADAQLQLSRNPTLSRSWFTTTAIRLEDGNVFTTFPNYAVLAHIEWTTNWCVAMRAHQFLMFHAGVLANKHGAVLFPGVPGAGKTTLCAYLMHNGWRLLSDEFTLVKDHTLAIHPFPRLLPLKNASIDVIRELVPQAHLGPSIPGTHKGTVAHLCPGDEHIKTMQDTAPPRLVVFPTYKAGAQLDIAPMSRSECFAELTQNSFNYSVRGEVGFHLAVALANQVATYRLTYSDLAQAATAIRDLMQETTVRAA